MDNSAHSDKLKAVALRNTRSTLIAYAVPSLIYSAVVVYGELTTAPYWMFIGLYFLSASFVALNLVVISSLPKVSYELGAPILYIQVSFFLLIFLVWIGLLEQGRYGGLFFALSMLVYTYAYGTRVFAVSINTALVVGYLGASYFTTHINSGDTRDLLKDVVAITAFLPVSILLGRVGSKLAIKKRKVKALLADQKKTQDHLHETLLKLEQAAKTDELTGLLNRREINNRLDYEFNKIKRNHTKMSVLILDLDHFKAINDSYGHHCGDMVLKHVATQLTNGFRETDSVSRWGGEEFIVLMPDTDLTEAKAVCDRALTELNQCPIKYNGQSLAITASGGLCEVTDQNNIEASLHQADEFLYEAKRQGRNRILSSLNSVRAV